MINYGKCNAILHAPEFIASLIRKQLHRAYITEVVVGCALIQLQEKTRVKEGVKPECTAERALGTIRVN